MSVIPAPWYSGKQKKAGAKKVAANGGIIADMGAKLLKFEFYENKRREATLGFQREHGISPCESHEATLALSVVCVARETGLLVATRDRSSS